MPILGVNVLAFTRPLPLYVASQNYFYFIRRLVPALRGFLGLDRSDAALEDGSATGGSDSAAGRGAGGRGERWRL